MRRKPSVAPCRRPATFAGAVLLLLAGVAAADDRPMSTDRPDLTEGATVVGDGTIQVETGLLTSFSDRPEVTTTTLPTLVRVGLGNWIELRGASNVYQRVSLERFSIDGFAPVELGVKVAVLDPGRTGGPLALAALVHVAVPSGERPFTRRSTARCTRRRRRWIWEGWRVSVSTWARSWRTRRPSGSSPPC